MTTVQEKVEIVVEEKVEVIHQEVHKKSVGKYLLGGKLKKSTKK